MPPSPSSDRPARRTWAVGASRRRSARTDRYSEMRSEDTVGLTEYIIANIAILMLFPLRWYRILRAQGYRVPYLDLVRYRLLAFAVSYFTPGQHFGGEPLQVLYLRNRHAVPGSAALASVTLDKVIDLFANFAVLALGLAALLSTGTLADLPLAQTLPFSIGLLLLPALYLWAVMSGRRPFGARGLAP